jgi:hypothetical protein
MSKRNSPEPPALRAKGLAGYDSDAGGRDLPRQILEQLSRLPAEAQGDWGRDPDGVLRFYWSGETGDLRSAPSDLQGILGGDPKQAPWVPPEWKGLFPAGRSLAWVVAYVDFAIRCHIDAAGHPQKWAQPARQMLANAFLMVRALNRPDYPTEPTGPTNLRGCLGALRELRAWAAREQEGRAVSNPAGSPKDGSPAGRSGKTAAAILDILRERPGEGMPGKEIVAALKKMHIEITEVYFRRHVVPVLREHGVRNHRSRGGYYIEPT